MSQSGHGSGARHEELPRRRVGAAGKGLNDHRIGRSGGRDDVADVDGAEPGVADATENPHGGRRDLQLDHRSRTAAGRQRLLLGHATGGRSRRFHSLSPILVLRTATTTTTSTSAGNDDDEDENRNSAHHAADYIHDRVVYVRLRRPLWQHNTNIIAV